MEKVSSDVLRLAAPEWSLGGDKQLLDLLQNIHQKIMTKCTETNAKLGELVDSLDTASVDLQNVNNKFMALSNSQFVECRVYDDDIDVVPAVVPPKEEQKQANPADELVQMKQCLALLESMHEPIQIVDSDSSDDEDERVVLKPKDMYAKRPLPYIIGTQQWKKKWHAGLVVEDSDSDSAGSGSKWAPREEYSDSEPEVTDTQTDKHIKDITISSSNASMEANLSSQVKPKPADIAAELARRLGGDVVPPPPTMPDLPPEQPKIIKVNRPHLPTTATLFPNEPPPLDQCESETESDDDIFAELHKKNYTRNDKVQNKDSIDDLFGDRPEVKVNNTKNKPIFDDDSEPEMFVEKPKEKTPEPQQREDGFKKPIGGISLFGSNKDSNSIGAAILKRNQRKSSSDEEDEPIPVRNEPKSIQKQADAKIPKNAPPKNIVDELFVKPKSKKTIKTNNIKDTNKNMKEKEIVSEKTKVDLFSDDIFDDIEDIFTSKVVKKPEEKKSIFEDDLFADVAVSKKEKSKDVKSIFDSDDDLFNDVPVSKPEKSVTVTKLDVNATNNNIANNSDLLDNDVQKQTSHVKPGFNVINDSIKNRKSIFDDDSDDDIFKDKRTLKTSHIKSDEKSEEKSKSSKTKSIFDDSDDELFAETKSKKQDLPKTNNTVKKSNNQNIDKNVNTVNIHEVKTNEDQTELISKETESNVKDNIQRPKKKSIFDDDSEEELFGSKKQTPKQKINNSEANIINNIEKVEDTNSDLPKDEKVENPPIANVPDTTKEIKPKNSEESNKSKVLLTSDIKSDSEDELFRPSNEKLNIPKSTPFESPSMFDDDEMDDLFSNKVKTTEIKDKNSVLENPNIDKNNASLDSNIQPKEINAFAEKSVEYKENTINEDTISQNDDLLNTSQPITNESSIEDTSRSVTDEKSPNNNVTLDKESNINESLESAKGDALEITLAKNIETQAKTDLFSDIFSDMPPEFEKPKETKRSKNVNALFDDDSDDEALFFKKDEVIPDDVPAYDANERFSIFHDEPPAIDVDFEPKPVKTTKIDNENVNKNTTDDIVNTKVESKNIETKSNQSDTAKVTPSLDESIRSTNAMISEKINKIQSDINKVDDSETKNNKSVGKLKPINLNINVNSLLPGASPKKSKPESTEYVDGTAVSSIENTQTVINKEVKTVNFEDEKESEILNNKLSKERAKIQVKRRPSTRRARKEAARKSGINFGDSRDSTDNSSSIDEPKSRTDKTKTLNSNEEQSGNKIITADTENANKDIENNFASSSNNNDVVNSSVMESNSNLTKSNKNVTSKVVYILNDEDIFTDTTKSIDKSKNETKSDIFEPISTLSSTYTDKIESSTDNKTSIDIKESGIDNRSTDKKDASTDKKASIFDSSDSDSELFGAKKKVVAPKAKLFDSDSDDDLFGKSKKDVKIKDKKEKDNKPKMSLFGGDSDEDLFSTNTKKSDDKILPPKETSKKPSEPVFEDPLSMLNEDN